MGSRRRRRCRGLWSRWRRRRTDRRGRRNNGTGAGEAAVRCPHADREGRRRVRDDRPGRRGGDRIPAPVRRRPHPPASQPCLGGARRHAAPLAALHSRAVVERSHDHARPGGAPGLSWGRLGTHAALPGAGRRATTRSGLVRRPEDRALAPSGCRHPVELRWPAAVEERRRRRRRHRGRHRRRGPARRCPAWCHPDHRRLRVRRGPQAPVPEGRPHLLRRQPRQHRRRAAHGARGRRRPMAHERGGGPAGRALPVR